MKMSVLVSMVATVFLTLSSFTVSFANPLPKMEITPMNFDFGSIKEGVKSKATYTIKNTGTGDLVIYDVRPTCGCTVANLSSKTIEPGKTATLEAVYDSHNANGQIRRFINVESNDPAAKMVSLTLTADVKAVPAPDIALSTYIIPNIQLAPGGSAQKSITITNPGQKDLTINEVTTSQGMAAEIGDLKVGPGKTVKASIMLKPGESKKMDVTIAPNITKGNFQEVVVIRSNSRRSPVRSFIVQGVVQ